MHRHSSVGKIDPAPDSGKVRISAVRNAAVIGGGWAGCAAAIELARKGIQVSLYEQARTLGGRARRVELNGMELDNGQHIMLGAYGAVLQAMRLLRIDPDEAFLRLPLQMPYPPETGTMEFLAGRLPAPAHLLWALLRARGLSIDDKLALARFSTTARWMGWKLYDDCTVSELLERYDQTERLTRLMWRPLCIAALNTPPERASAQVFLNVLRDSLGARRAASDMLLPRVDLTRLLPQRAAEFIETHGGSVRLGCTVDGLERGTEGWCIRLAQATGEAKDTHEFDAVVVATPPWQAGKLLAGHAVIPELDQFSYEAISTCYLQYEMSVRLARPFFALADDAARKHWGQFVFDRGQLADGQRGLLAVVVSASGAALEAGHGELAASIAQQLASVLRIPELEKPLWTKVISEKRATFSCTPSLARPANDTGCPGLALAGDYTAGDYPATLESAVRSGQQAAALLAG